LNGRRFAIAHLLALVRQNGRQAQISKIHLMFLIFS
jgi:hypothetical protein